MHLWPSKKVLKTSKTWNIVPPKNLTGSDLNEFIKSCREYKRIMLGHIEKKAPTGRSTKEN